MKTLTVWTVRDPLVPATPRMIVDGRVKRLFNSKAEAKLYIKQALIPSFQPVRIKVAVEVVP